jgi:hypothetical protein
VPGALSRSFLRGPDGPCGASIWTRPAPRRSYRARKNRGRNKIRITKVSTISGEPRIADYGQLVLILAALVRRRRFPGYVLPSGRQVDDSEPAPVHCDAECRPWPAPRNVITACSCRVGAPLTVRFTGAAALPGSPWARRPVDGPAGPEPLTPPPAMAPTARQPTVPDGPTGRPSRMRTRSWPGPGGGGLRYRRSPGSRPAHPVSAAWRGQVRAGVEPSTPISRQPPLCRQPRSGACTSISYFPVSDDRRGLREPRSDLT